MTLMSVSNSEAGQPTRIKDLTDRVLASVMRSFAAAFE